jgi:hypothetical protein
LAVVAAAFLFLPHLAHRLLRRFRRRLLLWLIAHEEAGDTPAVQTARSLTTSQPVPRLVPLQAQG